MEGEREVVMATKAASRKSQLKGRLLTVADLAELPDELPSGPVQFELDNGRLVVLPAADETHAAAVSNLAAELLVQGVRRKHGKARCGGVGIILWRNPDRVVGADVIFIASASLPIQRSTEGYLETIPDLVVEVRSKTQTVKEILDKVADYLHAGVKIVWVADPKKQTVAVHRRGRKVQVFKQGDTLTAEEIIPGFRLAVADVFQI